jgi:hypothetical protein
MKHYNPEEDLAAVVLRRLGRIERGLNVVTLGGIFILLIVSCDYLADMGWFGPDIQSFARR